MSCRLLVIVLVGTLSLAACSASEESLVEAPASDEASTTVAPQVAESVSTTEATPATSTSTTTSQAPDITALVDPDEAETCAELADVFVGLTQRMLVALGTRSDADMEGDIPPEIVAAGEALVDWFYGSAGGVRVTELCPGGDAEYDELVCDQASSLKPLGEAAERHLRDNFPTCDQ